MAGEAKIACDLPVKDIETRLFAFVPKEVVNTKGGKRQKVSDLERVVVPNKVVKNAEDCYVKNNLPPVRIKGPRIVRLNDEMFAFSGDFTFVFDDFDDLETLRDNVFQNIALSVKDEDKKNSYDEGKNGFQIRTLNGSFGAFNRVFGEVFDLTRIRRVCHLFHITETEPYIDVDGIQKIAELRSAMLYAGPDPGYEAEGTTIGRFTAEDAGSYKQVSPLSDLADVEGEVTEVHLYKTGALDDFFLYCAVKKGDTWFAIDLECACSQEDINAKLYTSLCEIQTTLTSSIPGYMYTTAKDEFGIVSININLLDTMKQKIGFDEPLIDGVWAGADPNPTDILDAANYRYFMNFKRGAPPLVLEAGDRPWNRIMGGANWFNAPAQKIRGGNIIGRMMPNTEAHWIHFD